VIDFPELIYFFSLLLKVGISFAFISSQDLN
jgi:hypothetical protein